MQFVKPTFLKQYYWTIYSPGRERKERKGTEENRREQVEKKNREQKRININVYLER